MWHVQWDVPRDCAVAASRNEALGGYTTHRCLSHRSRARCEQNERIVSEVVVVSHFIEKKHISLTYRITHSLGTSREYTYSWSWQCPRLFVLKVDHNILIGIEVSKDPGSPFRPSFRYFSGFAKRWNKGSKKRLAEKKTGNLSTKIKIQPHQGSLCSPNFCFAPGRSSLESIGISMTTNTFVPSSEKHFGTSLGVPPINCQLGSLDALKRMIFFIDRMIQFELLFSCNFPEMSFFSDFVVFLPTVPFDDAKTSFGWQFFFYPWNFEAWNWNSGRTCFPY